MPLYRQVRHLVSEQTGWDLRSTRRRVAGGCGAVLGLLSAIAIRPHNRTMAGVTWHYVLKFIITGESVQSVCLGRFSGADGVVCDRSVGDAAVGKSSLLVRLTDQRFLANPDPTVSAECPIVSRFSSIAVGRSSESNSGRS